MKKILSAILSFVMILSLSVSAFAASPPSSIEIPITLDSETKVIVVVPNELTAKFGLSEIEQLVANNDVNDGDIITIYEIVDAVNSPPEIQPYWGYTYKTTKTYGPQWSAQNYFIISAAKGQTTTLSSKFSQTLNTSVTVGEAFVKADIGGSVTAEYSVTHQFVGPPESSSSNTREFRVQFYAQTVTFTQQKIDSSNTVVDTTTGKASVPTKYALYSIDRKI